MQKNECEIDYEIHWVMSVIRRGKVSLKANE